jgi:probable 2-oxoglutarate dehydrogenase E1 component DHKTD1
MSPFPAAELKTVLSQYKNVKEYVWSQEEHRNMGAWSFVSPRFENILGIKLKYTGREVASCISGISSLHVKQVKEILSKPFDKF